MIDRWWKYPSKLWRGTDNKVHILFKSKRSRKYVFASNLQRKSLISYFLLNKHLNLKKETPNRWWYKFLVSFSFPFFKKKKLIIKQEKKKKEENGIIIIIRWQKTRTSYSNRRFGKLINRSSTNWHQTLIIHVGLIH